MAAITKRLAARHEALVLRLEALLRHAGTLAARRPELPVDAQTRALAEDILHQCRPFARRLGKLPPAAPALGALAAQLSEARARLEAFELRHTQWDPTLKCVVWETADAGNLPVGRLHPEPDIKRQEKETAEMRDIRMRLAARINAITKQPMEDPQYLEWVRQHRT